MFYKLSTLRSNRLEAKVKNDERFLNILGRGCGAVIGGMFVTTFGSKNTFRGYGLICILVLAVFIFINFYRVDQGFVSDLPQTEDPRQV